MSELQQSSYDLIDLTLKLFYIASTFVTLDPIFNVTDETPSNASFHTLLN
jgi:hypothetical protein